MDRASLGGPVVYGQDRVFVCVRLESAPDKGLDQAVEELERSGQPVGRIVVENGTTSSKPPGAAPPVSDTVDGRRCRGPGLCA